MSSELKFETYEPIKNLKEIFKPNEEDNIIITEKIHGSNFSIYIEVSNELELNIKYARRLGFISPQESFYKNIHLKVMEKYIPNIEKYIKTQPNLKNSLIRIVGELYGGWLNNQTEEGYQAIMKSNYSNYSLTNDFIVFDIIINNVWQTWDNIIDLCSKFQLQHVPELYRGKWKNHRISIELLNSKLSQSTTNTPAEGVVIRYINPGQHINSFPLQRDKRFKWKCHEMMNEGKTKNEEEKEFQIQKKQAMSMLNQERFNSYLSKVGPEFIKNKTNLKINIKSLIDDTILEIKEIFPDFNCKIINKELNCMAFNLINNYLII